MSDSEELEAQYKKIWQKVPTEERQQMLRAAHVKAVEVCSIVAFFGVTSAFSLSMQWILLCVAILVPVLFQVVVTRMWLDQKPKTIARYFMASRTASLYAKSKNFANPTLKTIFQGVLKPNPDLQTDIDSEVAEDYAEEVGTTAADPKEVWICLFPESLIMFSENSSGAKLEFCHSILTNCSIILETPEDFEGNPLPSHLSIETMAEDGSASKWLVTSQFASALVTCERKVRFFINRAEVLAAAEPPPAPEQDADSLFASDQVGATLESVSN